MEKVGSSNITTAEEGSKLTLAKKQKIRKFRGILGKASEETILWAIKEAEEL
ncbi:hypothetical protein [Thermococcus kodakarensis]|nr:hypothetical protein [Thermococcus kodakarensis]WCN28596.1 hypothetical protein POG15_02790 [Thermococcus kodakarensis]WCN30894.1 hypothetical protein POG21_02790 [Thermococcus kodakarensis]